jgi:hypothetical protein
MIEDISRGPNEHFKLRRTFDKLGFESTCPQSLEEGQNVLALHLFHLVLKNSIEPSTYLLETKHHSNMRPLHQNLQNHKT